MPMEARAGISIKKRGGLRKFVGGWQLGVLRVKADIDRF